MQITVHQSETVISYWIGQQIPWWHKLTEWLTVAQQLSFSVSTLVDRRASGP